YRLACELSNRIAAIAPVSGPMGVTTCNPSRPVSVLHLHGTDDDNARYNGGPGSGSLTRTNFRSVPESGPGWGQAGGWALGSPRTTKVAATTFTTYGGCRGKASVELGTIQGGTHKWPEPAQTGKPASDLIWEFFQQHPVE